MRILRTSRDFCDDEDGRAWHEAEADMRAYLDALAAALTTRCGAPVLVDLWSII